MDTKLAVQELKSERVQKELLFVDVADEPCWVSLKAERVQAPASVAADGNGQLSTSLELTVSQKQPMTIELPALGTIIKLHGTVADHSARGGGSEPGSASQPEAA